MSSSIRRPTSSWREYPNIASVLALTRPIVPSSATITIASTRRVEQVAEPGLRPAGLADVARNHRRADAASRGVEDRRHDDRDVDARSVRPHVRVVESDEALTLADALQDARETVHIARQLENRQGTTDRLFARVPVEVLRSLGSRSGSGRPASSRRWRPASTRRSRREEPAPRRRHCGLPTRKTSQARGPGALRE